MTLSRAVRAALVQVCTMSIVSSVSIAERFEED
jgi:hypothetical protein